MTLTADHNHGLVDLLAVQPVETTTSLIAPSRDALHSVMPAPTASEPLSMPSDSPARRVHGDPSVAIGGLTSAILMAFHPEVAACICLYAPDRRDAVSAAR